MNESLKLKLEVSFEPLLSNPRVAWRCRGCLSRGAVQRENGGREEGEGGAGNRFNGGKFSSARAGTETGMGGKAGGVQKTEMASKVGKETRPVEEVKSEEEGRR